MNKKLLILLTVALALASCNRKTIYSHYEHTPLDGWEKNDTLVFSVPPVRHDGVYREMIGLRTSSAYPFMGLTLVVEQEVWPSGLTRSDTLWCRLVDSDGNIQGEGISNSQYNFQLLNLRLNSSDSLRVTVRHNMKREILPGISDIGLTLTKKD
jgi:gliding motility-associated lipoprotein GldH